MEERIQKLEKELNAIRERNMRVEAEKGWETSWFRILLISGMTYAVACLILVTLKVENAFAAALLPTAGYFLSTQSLPFIKKWWIRNHK